MATVWEDSDGSWRTTLRRRQVLADPRINKGTAFSDAERAGLAVTGLIPAGHMTLEEQESRVYAQYLRQTTDLARNVLLTEVHDRNEVLFYRLLASHLSEMLPIVYTPTVGQAIENYSHEYRRPRGVYLSVDRPELIETSLRAAGPGSRRGGPDRRHRRRAPSSGSATGASAASTSRSASWSSTPRPAASTRTGSSRSCWTSAPTGRACLMTRCTSATATRGCRWRRTTSSIDAFVSDGAQDCSPRRCCTGRTSG